MIQNIIIVNYFFWHFCAIARCFFSIPEHPLLILCSNCRFELNHKLKLFPSLIFCQCSSYFSFQCFPFWAISEGSYYENCAMSYEDLSFWVEISLEMVCWYPASCRWAWFWVFPNKKAIFLTSFSIFWQAPLHSLSQKAVYFPSDCSYLYFLPHSNSSAFSSSYPSTFPSS